MQSPHAKKTDFLIKVPMIALCAVIGIIAGCISTQESRYTADAKPVRIQAPSEQGQAFSHYITSIMLERANRHEEALAEMKRTANLDPDAITPTLQMIRGHLREKDYDGALILAERAIEQASDRPNLHIVLGQILHQLDRDADAMASFFRAIALDPENVLANSALVELIRGHLREKNYDEALVLAKHAIEQDPDRPDLHIVLGQILHQLGQDDVAMASFTKAIELDPENMFGYSALVRFQESVNDLTAAIDIYHKLIELSPNTSQLHYQLALNLIRINDGDTAIKVLRRALELNPRLIRARYLLGVLLMEAGEYTESVGNLRFYLTRQPNDVAAAETLAGALAQLKRYDESIALYEQIISGTVATPDQNLAAMYLMLIEGQGSAAEIMVPPTGAPILGTFFRAIGRQDSGSPYTPLLETLDEVDGDIDAECTQYLNQLLYLFNNETAGNWILDHIEKFSQENIKSKTLGIIKGRTLMIMKRHDDAVTTLNAVLEEFGSDPVVHYSLAISYEELDNFSKTEEHLKAYLEFDENDNSVINFLAYLYAEKNVKLDLAEEMLNKALAAEPGNPYYLDSLGWVFYRKGMADKAIDHIQRAVLGMASDDAVLRDHLGDAYLLKGENEKAIAEWKRARRLDATLEGVQGKIDKFS